MTQPLIGITTYWLPAAYLEGNGEGHRILGQPGQDMVLSTAEYTRCVEAAGGVPVLLPRVERPEIAAAQIDRCDGLLLTGGADVVPCVYGGRPGDPCHRRVPARDRFEFQLLARALDRHLPTLGICRGYQLINVWCGGTLHHDLGEAGIDAGRHCALEQPMAAPTHRVTLAAGSALRGAYGVSELAVNSFHHQAIDRLGDGLVVVGRAEDGPVEAIEHADHPLLWGVQWHPEMMAAARPEHLAPFRLLAERAGARR